MRKKIFLLGVGCQKGGTTWLHDYLTNNPKVDMGFLKEYHVFDALDIPECKVFLRRKIRLLQHQLETSPQSLSDTLLKQLSFYYDTDNYFDYFDYLHFRQPEASLVGDITPSYCALPLARYQFVYNKLRERGFNVKVIFLLRDPFERIWSQLRMQANYAKKRGSRLQSKPEEVALSKYYRAPATEFRTRYDNTIKNLERVFPEEDIYYEFYETLFSDESVRRITTFLDIPFVRPELDKYVNASPKENGEISPTLVRNIVTYYRDTYRFCFDRFGEAQVRQVWKSTEDID